MNAFRRAQIPLPWTNRQNPIVDFGFDQRQQVVICLDLQRLVVSLRQRQFARSRNRHLVDIDTHPPPAIGCGRPRGHRAKGLVAADQWRPRERDG